MYKIYFALVFLFIHLSTYAFSFEDPSKNLLITVKNDSPETCYLIKRHLKDGVIIEHSLYKIPSGSETLQFIVMSDSCKYSSHLSMTYECGTNRLISMNSSQSSCGGPILGTKLKTENMDATYSVSQGSFFYSRPGNIYWTIQ